MGRGKREKEGVGLRKKPTVAGINSMRKQRIRGRGRNVMTEARLRRRGRKKGKTRTGWDLWPGERRSRSEKKERECKRKEGRPRNGTGNNDSSREGGGQEALTQNRNNARSGMVVESDGGTFFARSLV